MHKQKLLSGLSVVVGALFVFLLSQQVLVTQAASVWTSVPIEPRQATTSDLLSPGYSQTISAGNIVTFTHVLTNVTALTDSFALTATSSQGWPVELYGPTEALTLPVQLEAGLTTTVLLQVTVASGVVSGTLDTAIITATSQTSPTLTSESIDTTLIQGPTWHTYLPLVLLHWPPVPDAPVLNPINTIGSNGYYVTWVPASRAVTYTLQESTDAAFSSPIVRYTGTHGPWTTFNRPIGTYFYRVKATNSWGDSAWSNVQSFIVTQPPSDTIHGQVTYQGYPIAGVRVSLEHCHNMGTYWSCDQLKQSTSTEADGSYQFPMAESLGANEKYFVRFLNYGNTADPDYVGAWDSSPIYSYIAGQAVSVASFDIATVPLVAPAGGITTGFPRAFQWTLRATSPSDSYQLELWDAATETVVWSSPLLGYVSSYSLTSLPAGFTLGEQYVWHVVIHKDGGRGVSYEFRYLTFSGSSQK
ncbi:MAG: hypothetical protein HY870_25355 [Chloroflexi bacterium]|nr:hypothetical protein [Chloroflexota bacterium]